MSSPVAAPAAEVKAEERESAIRYLEKTRNQLCACVSSLTATQWIFKPAPGRWSVLENVDHLAVVEEMVRNMIENTGGSVPIPERNVAAIDALAVATMIDRSSRFKAPELINPKGGLTPQSALEQFREKCAPLLDILRSATGLRRLVAPHPLIGPMDGYQWILAVAAHNERHLAQILELRADPDFPRD